MTDVKNTKSGIIFNEDGSKNTKNENLQTVNESENIVRQLTDREVEVLKLLMMGKSNTKIGDVLGISPHTVKAHVCSILRKMSVNDRVQAAVKAVRENLVD